MYIHSHCEMALRYPVVKIKMYINYQMGSESRCSTVLPILHNKHELIQKCLRFYSEEDYSEN